MEQEEAKKAIKKKRKGWKIFLYILLFFLLLPILLSVLLNLKSVQNYVANQLTEYLSEKMEADVGLDHIDIDFGYGLELDGFYIAQNGDTVIKCGQLEVSLLNNLLSLRHNKLLLEKINLRDPVVNLTIKKGNNTSDLALLISKLFTSDGTGEKKDPLDIVVRKINVSELKFSLKDENNGYLLALQTSSFETDIDSINLKQNKFIINDLHLYKPSIYYEKFADAVPLPVAETFSTDTTAVVTPLLFSLNNLNIQSGTFRIENKLRPIGPANTFDPAHFTLNELNFEASNLLFTQKNGFSAIVRGASFEDDKGFAIKNFDATQLVIGDGEIRIEPFNLNTGNSHIAENVKITFNTWSDFRNAPEDIKLDGYLNASEIDLNELLYFIPNLRSNDLLRELAKDKLYVSGFVNGNLDQITINNLELVSGDKEFEGTLVLNNVRDKSKFNLEIDADRLVSTSPDIVKLFPKLNLPPNFKKLGQIQFSGKYSGTPKVFTVSGKLLSELGSADVAMGLDIRNGSSKAKYSGDVLFNDFKVGELLDIKDLGKITASLNLINGFSFDLDKASVVIDGKIDRLEYKGYAYKDLLLDGTTSQGNFEGDFKSTDPNFDIDFNGKIAYKQSIYQVNFDANIRKIDLFKLNLNGQPLAIKGDMSINGSGQDLNSFIGDFKGTGLVIERADTTYNINDIVASSIVNPNGEKTISISNNDINARFDGKMDLRTIINDVNWVLKSNLDYYAKNWKTPEKPKSNQQDFRFDVSLGDLTPYASLLGLEKYQLTNFKAKGYINSASNELQLASTFPFLGLEKNKLFNNNAYINLKNKSGYLSIHSDSSIISNIRLGTIDAGGTVSGDSILWSVSSDYLLDSIEKFSLRGLLAPHPEGYEVKVLNNDLRIYNKRWKLNPDNSIAFGKGFIDLENFNITDGTRTIEAKDILNKGILLNVNRFRFDAINAFNKDKKFYFDGEVVSSLRINDIFIKSPDIYGTFLIDQLTINGDSYGNLNLDISKPLNQPLESILSIENAATGQTIKANFNYDPETGNISSLLKGRRVPLKFLEYILVGGVSNVGGYVDIDGTLGGTTKNPVIEAEGSLHEGTVKVVYLGETYRFDNQLFTLTDRSIDLTGDIMYDSEGNQGQVTGGFTHRLFKQFAINASITGENVIALKTTARDNPTYYGRGQGQVEVDIVGPINKVNMVINATTKASTVLNIPISESASSTTSSIITFIDSSSYFAAKNANKKDTVFTSSGLSIEMNLNMTPDAQVNLIYDESVGDVIRGRGTGNLRIVAPRNESLQIYGDYEIEQGEYLFTARKIIAKPFVVRRGSTLRWSGDPVNAEINLEADYVIRTSLQNFLQEFLYSTAIKNAAANRTSVNLKLLLGNTLFNPSVQFDLEFPELTGELKNYADTKTRLLRNNITDFNGQVFSLIIWNSFLPSNTLSDVVSSGGGIIGSATINTLSEFLSSQLSLFVTSLINDALTENGLISSVDFNLNLRNNVSFDPLGGTGTTVQQGILPSEIEVRLNPRFRVLNERLEFNVGGNYIRQNSLGQVNYVVPDLAIQYALTADRKLSLKVYGKYDFDEIQFTSRRQKYGTGVRFRTEFGSMLDTEADLAEYFKNNIVQGNK